MSRRFLRIRPAAEADLSEAYLWYECQAEGLGDGFLDEVGRLYERMQTNPFMYPEVEQGARRALVRRFPYTIYFLTSDEEITVLGILRQSRHPGLWKERL